MDESKGFFPERELLAYRRSLLRPTPDSGNVARQDRYPWWVLPLAMLPVVVGVSLTTHRLGARGHLPPSLLFGCWLLAACALAVALLGIGIGGWRGLRRLQRS